MSTQELFCIAAVAFLLAALLSLYSALWMRRVVFATFAAAVLMMLAGFGVRWHFYASTMHIDWLMAFPVSTFYESAAFFVLAVVVTMMFYFRQGTDRRVQSFVLFFCGIVLLLLNLSEIPNEPVLFLPSLKSYWLVVHVTLSFVAYAMYALAACLAFWVLFGKKSETTCSIIRKLVIDATLIFTVGGLIFGAIWAQHSWGRFWAWDPKETWAFITWCAYVVMLHTDWRRHLSAKTLALWSIVNFGIVLFTYFGVSIFFAGLHSYISLPGAQ